jgi:hypothetical protein
MGDAPAESMRMTQLGHWAEVDGGDLVVWAVMNASLDWMASNLREYATGTHQAFSCRCVCGACQENRTPPCIDRLILTKSALTGFDLGRWIGDQRGARLVRAASIAGRAVTNPRR